MIKPKPPPNHHSPGCPEVNLFSSAVNDISKKRASPIAGSAPARSLSVLKLISPSKTSSPNPPLPIIAVSIAILLASMAANFIPANTNSTGSVQGLHMLIVKYLIFDTNIFTL